MKLDQRSTYERAASRSNLNDAAPDWGTNAATIVRLTVGEAASRAFQNQFIVSEANEPTPDQDPSFWSRRASAALERADPSLVRSLRIAASRASPAIVVRGFPVGPIPPMTPYDGVVDLALSRQSVVNLHAVLGCLGLHPIAYARENVSTLHAVCPMANARGTASSRGFDTELPFHTDYADRPIDEPLAGQSPVPPRWPSPWNAPRRRCRWNACPPAACCPLCRRNKSASGCGSHLPSMRRRFLAQISPRACGRCFCP